MEEFRLPAGGMVEYVHRGYGSKFERYLMINIEKGVVVGTRIIGSGEYEKEREATRAEQRKAKPPWWKFWK